MGNRVQRVPALQRVIVSCRTFGVLPPVCVFAESRSTLGKTAGGVEIVDQACAEEVDAVLEAVGGGDEV